MRIVSTDITRQTKGSVAAIGKLTPPPKKKKKNVIHSSRSFILFISVYYYLPVAIYSTTKCFQSEICVSFVLSVSLPLASDLFVSCHLIYNPIRQSYCNVAVDGVVFRGDSYQICGMRLFSDILWHAHTVYASEY